MRVSSTCGMVDPDELFDSCQEAIERQDWSAVMGYADKIREWCISDDAQDYDRRSVESFRAYANLLNLNHGHRVQVGD